MSAEIISFFAGQTRRSGWTEFLNQTRSPIQLDDLTMDHADTPPCASIWPCEYAVCGHDVTDAEEPH